MAIQDKIIQGRLEKFFMERCLVDQPYIRDPEGKQKVKDLVAAAKAIAPPGVVSVSVRIESIGTAWRTSGPVLSSSRRSGA